MEVKFEKLTDVTGQLTVTLVEQDYADKVKKRIKEIGRDREEPGYRKGHAPEGLLKKKYGAAVKYDVVNKMIGDALFDYIRENKLNVLGQPVADPSNVFNEEAPDFTFKFEVGLAPEIDLKINKDIHVPYYKIEVTDEMVANEITNLQRRLGRQVSGEQTEPDAVIKGIISELNPDGTVKPDGIVVENGILAPVHFTDEEQKKLFEGKKVGDNVVFNPSVAAGGNVVELSSMLNIDKADVENHKGDFNFQVTDIIVLKPAELDQEFYDQALGKDRVHNEDELKEAIKQLIADTFENDSNFKFSLDAKEELLKLVGKVELPDKILKEYLMRQNEELTGENVDEEYEKMVPQITWDLVKGDVESQLDVKVTDEDIKNEARGIVIRQLSQYGGAGITEQLVDHYADQLLKDNKHRSNLYNGALNRKTYDAIRENVSLDVKNVSLQEFNNFFAPAQA